MFTLSGSTAQLKRNEGNPINLQVVSVLGIYLTKGHRRGGMAWKLPLIILREIK